MTMVKKETVVTLVAKFAIGLSESTRKMSDIFVKLLQNLNFREISVPPTTKIPKNPFKVRQIVPYESKNGQTDRGTHILNLIFAFHNNFANAPPPPPPPKKAEMWLISSQ